MIRLLIAGSRSFTNYADMVNAIYSYYSVDQIAAIISGGARGADTLAKRFAVEHEIAYEEYLPDWSIGRQAGILRNIDIVNVADEVIVFWDGKSNGSKFTISYSQEQGKPCRVVITTEE